MPKIAEVEDMIRKLETGAPITQDDETDLIGMLAELLATLRDDPEAE